eukprot:CAMPEP_0116877874 /NCGR_PEP_ID=MMETSP0463-20121206/9618_1 /TAXON_ID=181622 /ORGANISM="Strombidinopsis sp, Strain SopsisLIS2011" /LENGTH=63 /DNA_ID=CAMNT_0004525519 /DNA_START=90 /DNA_END=281 /DNA_ORIENTATION=-
MNPDIKKSNKFLTDNIEFSMMTSLYGLIQGHMTKAFKSYYDKSYPDRIEKLKNSKTDGLNNYI